MVVFQRIISLDYLSFLDIFQQDQNGDASQNERRETFLIQLVPQELKGIKTQARTACKRFFGELNASGCSSSQQTLMCTVMMRLIQQVLLVTMYNGKNRIYFTLGYVISRALLSKFVSNGRQVAKVISGYMELLPVRKLNFMQSVKVANGKLQIGVDSGFCNKNPLSYSIVTRQYGLILFPAVIVVLFGFDIPLQTTRDMKNYANFRRSREICRLHMGRFLVPLPFLMPESLLETKSRLQEDVSSLL